MLGERISLAWIFALAITLFVTLGVTQPAQAQTFTVIHNFSSGRDGAQPYTGFNSG